MIKLCKQRYALLKPWYPELTSPSTWAHPLCLAGLGLHPFPRKRLNLEKIIGMNLAARISQIVKEHPDVRGPRELVDVVYQRVKVELSIPTLEAHKQLRYFVGRWIITRYAFGGRGREFPAADDGTIPQRAANVAETMHTTCQLCEWMGMSGDCVSVHGSGPVRLPRGFVELVQLSDEKTRALTNLAHEMATVLPLQVRELELRLALRENGSSVEQPAPNYGHQ